MRRASAAGILAIGAALSACAPYPAYLDLTARERQEECAQIGREYWRQVSIAERSSFDSTFIVAASVQLNAWNVMQGLRERAVIAQCGPLWHRAEIPPHPTAVAPM